MTKKITKILIANRGEIARRIKRAAESLGLETVSIASEADRDALFAREATHLAIVGPAPASESYLAIDKIIAAAQDHHCDAIHPGYGFLSENAEFALAAAQAHIVFIGPDPEHIRSLGSKTEARNLLEPHGIPCTPGCPGGLSDEQILAEAERIGYPVMVKA
ncbi:MAG: acetyl-CoA carboxylase biotin carboxylase subunit, partial [Bdellovibrionales bacterium]|nr:acetyl-CoA carboxylase biotin carboxylase subunit [Bdellovibrionales bacterium]